MKITHKELVDQISLESGYPRKEVAKILQALADIWQRNISVGREVVLARMGVFRRGVAARGKRVLNGQETKGQNNVVHFRTSRQFLDRLRKSNA